MREILFRGKREDNGEWIEGFYSLCCFGRFPAIPAIIIVTPDTWQAVDVIPETVGQYAGRRDKNDKPIFEGDIVKDDNGRHLKVFWNSLGSGGWWFSETNSQYHVDSINLMELEVIGNIHDNPELLEKGGAER